MNSYIKNQPIIVFLLFLFVSCAPVGYYQLLDVKQTSSTSRSNALEVTNEFWSDGGIIFSYLKNTTDKVIYVDLANSHLVLNDFAYTYYSGSLSAATINKSIGVASTNPLLTPYRTRVSQTIVETSQTIVEQRIIIIPPNSIKTVRSAAIQSTPYRSCDLVRNPRKTVATIQFGEKDSPFAFRTLFSYGLQETSTADFTYQTNQYYVSNIANYKSKDFVKLHYPEVCGERSAGSVIYFPFYSPEKFYIKYSTDNY
jgi:hypothetical protein